MAKNIFEFQQRKVIPKIKLEDGSDRHVAMMQAIAPYSKSSISKNLTPLEIVPATKKSKVMLILMPEWNTYFPPFNLARLSAIARRSGYSTKALDLNVKAHNYFHSFETPPIDFDPWDPGRFFQWQSYYFEKLHPIFKDFFLSYIDSIVEYNPDLVGFTAYYCNFYPVRWFAEEIKKRLPNVKLAIGGPYMQTSHKEVEVENFFNYGIIGEGEILFLKMLSEVEQGMDYETVQIYSQPEEQRINLNNMPIPDYSDFDFNEYRFPNGILSEFSRGCVAKCTFCDETHFWKYRQRQAVDAIDEIEQLYYSKGTDVVWFIDSLVNGNLNELRAFAKGVIAKGLDIHWTGYARCDGRMDLEYYKDLAASGCTVLNYGCESASNSVLENMDKRVTVAEMEQNFIDGHKVGVAAMTNWVIGYPTETSQDFADSLTFLHRMKNYSIVTIQNATGFVLGPNSIIGQNFNRFNVANVAFCNHWITLDYTFGKPHVLTRSKAFSIFLQNILLPNNVGYVNRGDLPINHYSIKYAVENLDLPVDYEKFDYNIIQTNISTWADKLVNEIFVLFRLLWMIRGGYELTLKFDKELDVKEFGDGSAGELTADHYFKIDFEGNWEYKVEMKFEPPTYNQEKGIFPWYYHDYSDFDNSAAMRARKLAKSEFGLEKRSEESKNKLINLADRFNNGEINLAFEFNWAGNGKWKRKLI